MVLRRLSLALLLSLFLVNSALATDYAADANCQGAWLFTEGSGITVADASQNSNTGTFTASSQPSWETATPSSAYSDDYVDFDAGEKIDAGNGATLQITGNNFSITCWAKANSLSAYEGPFSKTDAGWIKGWGLYWFSDNTMRFYINHYGNSPALTAFTDTSGWHHWAGTYDDGRDSGSDVHIYLDGVIGGTKGSATALVDSGDICTMGTLRGYDWDGWVDETAIFDSTLDSTEINDIMDNGLSPVAAAAGQVIIMMN